MSSVFEACAEITRRYDYDRFLTVLFAPSERRGPLFALYAFNHEIAKVAETVTQPVMGQIRLQWWREAIDEIFGGTPRRHEVVQALATVVRQSELPRDLLDAMIDARELDLEPVPFASMRELENYADATSGHVMRLAARVLGAGDRFDVVARDAGLAYAQIGILRAVPFHAAAGRVLLPRDMLAAAGVHEYELASGRPGNVGAVIREVAAEAERHYAAARKHRLSGRYLPALLPAALAPLYLGIMRRGGFDPFRNRVDVSVPRRQLALMRASITGRV